MIPGWFMNNSKEYSEYFISEDGWCISYKSDYPVYLDKYNSFYNFEEEKNKEMISTCSRELLSHLFAFGWKDEKYFNLHYDGDFFK